MTYAETAQLYVEAGWGVPFPLPAGRKHPPPDGVTGQHGTDLKLTQRNFAHLGNYGLRMPEGVMGLDVDVYGDKHGDVVIADLEDKLGPLPAGPWSSSRGWPSGIRFYRIPAGVRLRGAIPGGVEIIQRHHRYAVVWPSVVEDRAYAWSYGGPNLDGTRSKFTGELPSVAELPELPESWLAWLQEGAADATGPAADARAVAELEAALFAREGTCPEVAGLLADADARMAEAAEGGRHDAMTGLAFRLAHLCVAGHLSWGSGAHELERLWHKYVGYLERQGEFLRIMRTALAKVGPIQSSVDPCALTVGPGYVELEITADVSAFPPPLGGGVARELPAAPQVFDPVDAYDDRALGLAVLAHVGGGVRWLLDAGGWLHRGPEAWSVSGSSLIEGARSCVATAVRTLPRGRKDAEEGSTERRRYENRRVLTSSAGLGRVASWIGAEVASAGSPLGIRLSSLDAEPEVLWAGGVAWDLRASAEAPVLAQVDPGTPHTRSAGVTPADVPTPLWDAFCAAVWPDPEQRAWALRVLGIAVTGYADRAMPILWGPRGRGKTQVLALVSDVLGTYAVAADPRLLGSGEHHGSVTLALAGARLAWIDEGPRSGHWATERLKALTGGGEMTGNPMRGNPVTFRPTHTLCLTSNDEPQVSDEALRSRVRSIQCGGDLEAVRDTRHAIGHLSGKVWAAERPGVLAQLIAEAAAWLDNPRTADNPHAVEAVLERLAREQDPVLSWLDDRTSPAGWTPSSVLYEDFRIYCQRSGISPSKVPSLTRWGRDLNAQGVLARRGAQGVQRDRTLHDGGAGPYTPAPVPPAAAFLGASAGPLPPVQGAEFKAPGAELDAQSGAESKPDLTRGSAEYVELSSRDKTTSINNIKSGGSDVLAGKPEVCPDPTHALVPEPSSGLPAVVLGGVVRPLGLDDAAALLGTLAGQSVTLDVEHTGYPIGHPAYALRTIQLGTSAFAVVLDAASASQRDLAADTLDRASEIVAHAAQADVIPVALSVDQASSTSWWPKVTDTAVLGALADPHLTGTDRGHALDLKGLSGRLLGDPVSPQADKDRAAYFRKHKWLTNTEPTTDPARSGWAQADYAEPVMATYAASDVLDTAALRRTLPEPPPELLERERRVLATTARIAERGLLLDGDWIETRRAEAHDRRTDLREQLAEAGVAEPGSTQQLGARLAELGAELPKTPTGKPSTASDALEDLARYETEAGTLAQAVLAWREQDKLLGTYLEPYGLLVKRGDGRVRPTVQTLGAAATGRMSVVRPNLQQVPKVGGIRGCVVADPGHLLIAADFSSVEIRVAAALSGDTELAVMLREGVDVHGRISAVVWGPDWTKANRYAVKRVVFGKMYGSGRANLAKQMGEHHARVDDVIEAMEQITPGFVQWSARLQQEVRSGLRPVWRHPSGRLTYLPSETPHKAPNYAIQSTARELLVDALERWERTRPGHVLLPIHDEILVQVPEDQAEQATLDLVACMTTDLAGVPITAEAATPSARWADAT